MAPAAEAMLISHESRESGYGSSVYARAVGRAAMFVVLVPLSAVLLLLAGCASSEDSSARAAAQSFESAIEEGDGSAACALLAEKAASSLESASGTACPVAIRKLALPAGAVGDVEIWGRSAKVTLDGDTLFLNRAGSGWLVTGAGCQPQPGEPYDCKVEV
jgi:hypothetical protein